MTTSQETTDALRAATFQRLHPRVYLERFLAEKIRPDGRTFEAWRDVSINVGSISTADGSALVRLGNTTVVCGVKAEIAEPELDVPQNGFLVPNLDLPAICSPKFKPGPPTEEAQVLSERLNEALVTSGVLPLSSLCIEPGKSVWVLYVDATCINYDGNAFDATLLAMVAALENTRLPTATFDIDTDRTICTRSKTVPLEIVEDCVPVPMSLGIFDSSHILADPTSFEEPLLSSTVTIVLNSAPRPAILSVSQLGPSTVVTGEHVQAGSDVLDACIAVAQSRRPHLLQQLR